MCMYWFNEDKIQVCVARCGKRQKILKSKVSNGKTTLTVWDNFKEMWENKYVGYPDTMEFDQGTQFTSAKWNSLLLRNGIQSEIRGGNPQTLGVGKRYHSCLRQMYKRIHMDSPHLKLELMLSITIKICNETSGINGLSPTLLMFGVISRLHISTKDSFLQYKRMKVIKVAREGMSRTMALERIKVALSRNVSWQKVLKSSCTEKTGIRMDWTIRDI